MLEFVAEFERFVAAVAQSQNSATALHCSAVRRKTESEIIAAGDQRLSGISTVPEFEQMRLAMAFEASEAP